MKKIILKTPVVTILGHVDHGKTTLLDAVRGTNVATREAGGITQKIGAFQIIHKKKKITFIDTPGHEAFAKMRSRGASAADIAVLVVAVNDGVQPQTKESIAHIKAANIPHLVALTKTDLPNISLEKIKKQLSVEGVLVEGYGGDIVCVPVSAKEKQGIEELLDMILLIWEMNYKGNKGDKGNQGNRFIVIESYMNNKIGPLIHAIVRQGVLKTGEKIYIDGREGKIRALINDRGEKITQAVVGDPVEIQGFTTVPVVGSIGTTSGDDKESSGSKDFAASENQGEDKIEGEEKAEVEEVPTGDGKRLPLILRADNEGSLEAIKASLPSEIDLILSGTGNISESDILLAKTTRAFVVGFNVRIEKSVAKLGETEGVMVKTYEIIYELLEEVGEVAESIHEVLATEKITGRAEIVQDFLGTKFRIAGCRVREGKFMIGDKVRVERGEKVIGEAKITSIKSFKEDVQRVSMGNECGIVLSPEVDFRLKDVIICAHPIVKK